MKKVYIFNIEKPWVNVEVEKEWKIPETPRAYQNKNDAIEIAIDVVKKFNQIIENDMWFLPIPLEPQVAENKLFWGNKNAFYVEVVEMDVL